MLWYKAWRESRARFVVSAVTIAGLCVGFVVFHRDSAEIVDRPITYAEYIWRIVYKGYLRELFVLITLLLGVGGLLREQDLGTAGFTLALPVSRPRIASVRAIVGLLEVTVLSLLPALVLTWLSPLFGEIYPWSQAWQFALLWTAGGAIFFMTGFLASSLFGGEYTAMVVALVSLLLYSAVGDLPRVEKYSFDIHDIMSGAGMPYFQSQGYLLTGPLPWNALGVIVLMVLTLIALANWITQRQDV
jgi:ABC-2 type transport system permease protein